MDKKDIYEHLANIYLDASSKRKKKSKKHLIVFKSVFLLVVVAVISVPLFLFHRPQDKPINSEVALVLNSDPVKINFNFNPAKKEIYSINLNKLDMNRFKSLSFSAKKINHKGNIALRLEFINAFKEKSEIYVRDLPGKWQEYTIDFANFNKITDWSQMASLNFIVEEWNSGEDSGLVYIENIRVLN